MAKPKKDLQYEDLVQQVAELTEALQRERADAINLRARAEKERGQMADFFKAMVVKDFLPVIDNLERALKHAPKELSDSDYIKGIQGVANQLEKVLSDMGVERIKTIGEHFDPLFHEAISMENGDGNDELVSEELQPGYKIGNEVIRHAMVRVKKG